MDFLGNSSDSEVDFTINEDYAKKYEKWRRGEELQKLKDKYGDVEDSESSTSEEEDEDGRELTEDIEKQFYKTLSCLKEKNPKIYDQSIKFFEESKPSENVKDKDIKKKNEEVLTLAGYQRKVLLETGGEFKDEDAEKPFELKSNEDQENDIKQSFRDVLKDSDNEDEETWGNLFTKRIKTAEELEKEEEDYRLWLAGENEKLKNEKIQEELKGLHDYWTNPQLDEGEKFLRDYVLNKRYLSNEDKRGIPSYDEIVHDSDVGLSADEDAIAEQDDFERKYNFRFEEPDKEFIKRFPRTVERSMRKKDERRKKHREDVKQRKQTERSRKDEELKRLKSLKKKEIMEKIKKLQQITGNDDMPFQTEDLVGDFDPESHDKRMAEIFDDKYYGVKDDEEEKPEFPCDEDLEIENWDEWDGYCEEQDEEELHCEDPGFNMDCDYDPTKKKELQRELVENSRRRKSRRKSKFAEALAREKPVFDPKDKTFEQYVDEYYGLDYEDLIGDIPCRFKYRKVVPNDYGLTIEEILNATDQELNRWVSLKKIVGRFPEHVQLYDVKAYKRKALNISKKKKCFPSLFAPKDEDAEQPNCEADQVCEKEEGSDCAPERRLNDVNESLQESIKKKKKKKKKNVSSTEADIVKFAGKAEENKMINISNADKIVSGKSGKKKKEKWIIEDCNTVGPGEPNDINLKANSDLTVLKKKKKRKTKGHNGKDKEILDCGSKVAKCESVPNESSKRNSRKRKRNLSEQNRESSRKRNEVTNHKKRKTGDSSVKEINALCNISDERLKSYGLNPKKFKNKLKYKNKNKQKNVK